MLQTAYAKTRKVETLMKRTRPTRALRAIACIILALVIACQPLSGIVTTVGVASASTTGEGTATATAGSALTLAGRLSALSSTASWKKANGTSSYTLGSSNVKVSGVARVGVDVSKWQGGITWSKVAAAGIDFAVVRCGYGSNKKAYDDAYFATNVSGATSAGIDVGVYLYSYATTVAAARSEAKHALRVLSAASLDANSLALPVFLDMEDSSQSSLSNAQLAKIARTFCNTVAKEGYSVGVYSSSTWWESKLTAACFRTQGWYRWVARWPTAKSATSSGVDGTALWQFTSSGTVPGISGNVDVNFDYNGSGSYTTLTAKSAGYDRVRLTWTKVADASAYEVQRKEPGGTFATVRSLKKTSFVNTGLSCNTLYRFRIRAVYTTDGETTYGNWWKTLSARPKPAASAFKNVSMAQTSSVVVLTWKKVSGASGFEVWRKTASTKFRRVKSLSASKRTWRDTGRTLGVVHTYKVRAWRNVGGTRVSGPFCTSRTIKVRPARVVVKSAVSRKTDCLSVTWGAIAGASGYRLAWRSASGGEWQTLDTRSKSLSVSGVTYANVRVRVRAWKRTSSKTWWGAWSAAKTVAVK